MTVALDRAVPAADAGVMADGKPADRASPSGPGIAQRAGLTRPGSTGASDLGMAASYDVVRD